MKRIISIVGIVLVVLLVGVGGIVGYVTFALPDVDAPESLSIEYTPERIERGKYLATAVSLCIDCHSNRDWTRFAGPVLPGTFGKGGERFDQSMGFPGVFYSRNITPAALADYSDAELYRAITSGVDRHGRALFPMMPYLYYGKMDAEDIYSIIAYVRSLEPIENAVPDSKPDFPVNLIINTLPSPPSHSRRPDPSDVVHMVVIWLMPPTALNVILL